MNDQFRKYKIKIIDEYIEQKWICKDKLKAKSKFEYDVTKKKKWNKRKKFRYSEKNED